MHFGLFVPVILSEPITGDNLTFAANPNIPFAFGIFPMAVPPPVLVLILISVGILATSPLADP